MNEQMVRRMTVTIDSNGKIEEVTGDFKELTGYSKSELIRNEVTILIPSSHKERHNEGFNRWNQHRTKKAMGSWIAIPLLHKDGSKIPLQMCLTERQGKVTGFFTSDPEDVLDPGQILDIIEARKVLEKELTVARDIQMSMVPLLFPAFPERDELDIYAALIPAREVGGDFYDFYFLDDDHLLFTIGDVSGKGVPAALMMAVCITHLKSRATSDLSTASILTQVNNEMAKENNNCMFVTVFLAILNVTNGELVYSNAGHNPSFIKRKEGDLEKLTELHGPPVAVVEGLEFKESRTQINIGDVIFAYTDGIPEEHNVKGEMYSDEKLHDMLLEHNFVSAKKITEDIIASVADFKGKVEQFDDITAICIEFYGNDDQ